MRFNRQVCFCIGLIALAVQAYAQGGRGGQGGATNDFYRFNYNGEDMQPIKYPAQPITSQHQITLHGETIKYTAHVGFIPIKQATSGITQDALDEVGIPLAVWRIHRRIGMSGGLFTNMLLRETGIEGSPELLDKLRHGHAAAYRTRAHKVRPLPGAVGPGHAAAWHLVPS